MNDTDRFDFDALDDAIRMAVIAAEETTDPNIFALADAYTPRGADIKNSPTDVLRAAFDAVTEPVKITSSTLKRALSPINEGIHAINRMRGALSQSTNIFNRCLRIADTAMTFNV